MDDEKKQLERDNYGRLLRNIADLDYISARTLIREKLIGQSLVLSQQAIEKYLKSILIYSHISKVHYGHRLVYFLKQCEEIVEDFSLSNETVSFIKSFSNIEDYRYGLATYAAYNTILPTLDKCVWELRRYAQKNSMLDDKRYRIAGGTIEQILKSNSSITQEKQKNLTWRNQYYFIKKRGSIKGMAQYFQFETDFFHSIDNKEIDRKFEALNKYVHLSKKVKNGIQKRRENNRKLRIKDKKKNKK